MLAVAVLGPVEVRRDGELLPVPAGRTTDVLIRLALEAGRPVRAERIIDDVWPDGATGRNTLQSKVSQLRRALGDPGLVTSSPAGYTLTVDVRNTPYCPYGVNVAFRLWGDDEWFDDLLYSPLGTTFQGLWVDHVVREFTVSGSTLNEHWGADEIYVDRFSSDYARPPTFDESVAFRRALDDRVSAYLSAHPNLSTSTRASQFTFSRRVAVGMTRDEVILLLGAPLGRTDDMASMATSARQFWPAVGRNAREMWSYHDGWSLYFDGDRLVDMTVVGKPP